MLACLVISTAFGADDDRLILTGKTGPGNGKRIVLVSGEEEYR